MTRITRDRCGGKARYHTIKMAEHNQRIRERATDTPLYIYHCPDCEGWHLTKSPQGEEREDVAGTTCNRCGMPGLVLMHTGVRWKLFEEKGHEHVCRALDSDFEDLTK